MLKKLIITCVVGLSLFSCSLNKPTITEEDDYIKVDYIHQDYVTLTNKTDRDIIIRFVMSDGLMSVVEILPPMLTAEVDLPAKSTNDFSINGFDEIDDSFGVSYYFADCEDVDNDNMADETYGIIIDI